jgi:hypothetical protein
MNELKQDFRVAVAATGVTPRCESAGAWMEELLTAAPLPDTYGAPRLVNRFSIGADPYGSGQSTWSANCHIHWG